MGPPRPRLLHPAIQDVSNRIQQQNSTFAKNVGGPAEPAGSVDDSAAWLDVSVDSALDHFLSEAKNSQPVGDEEQSTEAANLSVPLVALSRLSTPKEIIVELHRPEATPLVGCISAPTEPLLPAAANVAAALSLILSWVAAAAIATLAFLGQAPTVVPRHGLPTAQSSTAPTSLTFTWPRR